MDEFKLIRGDIVRNNHAGDENPLKYLLYIGKGTIRQGRYTSKSYDFIGYDGKKVQLFRNDADIEIVSHMDEFDSFLDALKRLKDIKIYDYRCL